MGNSNKIKADLLGMPHGTANARLRKMILFKFVKELGLDVCYRCKNKIENIDELSIEHVNSWQLSATPVETFFDLENISFSHLNCNVEASDRTYFQNNTFCGEDNGGSKLKEWQVLEIRDKLSRGRTLVELSKEYSCDERNIARIRDKKTWKEI